MPNRDPVSGRYVKSGGGAVSGGSSGGGFNLGNAYGAVIIDVSGVGSAMQQAQSMIAEGVKGIGGVIGGIGDTINAIGDQMSRVGGAISTFSAPIAVAGAAGLKAAADFDTLLKQIEIFGGVAPDQLETVRQFALKMGADTKYSSSDAAAAMLELLKAGQSLDDAMKSLPEVLNLAATGNIELAQASGIVSSALAIFKLNAGDASRVSNALAQAANATRADVADLGQGLTNVGPIAAQFEMSIEDTAAVLGVFANNGIMGAEAGTQLKSMLLNMSRPTDKVTGAFTKLGVSLYDSNGNARNFNTVIKELDFALDKLPIQQQNELMQDLAGSYGIVGLNALRASNGIDGTLQAMANAPSAGKVAATFMETFKGGVESLTGSFETLMISGLTPFMNDVAGPLVKNVTGIVNAITDWTQKNPALTKQIVKVLAGVAVLGPGLLVAGKAFSSIGELVKDVGKMFTFFTSGPLGLIIGGAAALFLAFQTNFLGIRDIVEPFVKNFLNNIDEIWGSIKNFGANLQDFGLGTAIASVIDSVMEALGLAANSDDMSQWAQQIGDGLANAFGSVATFVQTTVLPTLQTLGDWFLTDALPAVVSFVQTTVIPGIQTLFTFLGNAWAIIGPALSNFANWFLVDALPKVRDFVVNEVKPKLDEFFGWLGRVWNETIAPGLNQLKDWFLTDALPKIRDFVTNELRPKLEEVFGWLGRVWEETIAPGLNQLKDWFLTDALPKIKTFVEVDFKNALDGVFGWLSRVWEETVAPGLQGMYDWFVGVGGLQGIIKAVQDFFGNISKLPGEIQKWIDKQGPLVRIVEDLIIALGIVSGVYLVYNVVAGIAATISAAVALGIGAITTAVGALLSPIGLAIIGLTALIALYHEVARLQAGYANTLDSAQSYKGINANGLTREQFLDKAFASSVAELGDFGARTTWGGTNKGVYQGVGGMAAKWYDENVAGGKITVPQRDSGGYGMAMQPYMIGKSQLQNEIFIPGASGQFVNDFVDLMKGVAAGVTNSRGGDTINVQMPAAALANPAGAYAAGQDFGRGLADEMRSQGVKGVR